MKNENLIERKICELREVSKKSDVKNSKHACIAIKQGIQISPIFYNYMRVSIFNYKCGSLHAEMSTINYLINSLFPSDKIKRCVLQSFT